MSYQVLARKWRPKRFQDLMGQAHVVTVLMNALAQQRLHHAYLFTGTRGVGKTTIARIFAKSLNCDQGISAEPCGQCATCVDIDQGNFVDLLEIDAASRTKVDDTREILDNVQYAPSRGRYKVYLIDEVHMLSKSSFNALLKTLEEPPEHVKFILATTDPQKLPITVLSRCLQFHLKALTAKQIQQQLTSILSAENVSYDAGVLALLAKAARGSMRDSLSLTDQAIAQGKGHISLTNVQQMLGGIDQNWVYKIVIALIKQDAQELMQQSLNIASYAPSYNRLLAELIQLFHQIALTQVVGSYFDLSPEQNQLLEKFCRALSPEDVQLYYQIALNGRKDLPYANDEQAAFDMVLLRLLAFKPLENANELPEQNASREQSISEPQSQVTQAKVSFDEQVNTIEPAEEISLQASVQIADVETSTDNLAVAPVQEVSAQADAQPSHAQSSKLPADELLAESFTPQEQHLFAEQANIEQMAAEQMAQGQYQTDNTHQPQQEFADNLQASIDHSASQPEPSAQYEQPSAQYEQQVAVQESTSVDQHNSQQVFAQGSARTNIPAEQTFSGDDSYTANFTDIENSQFQPTQADDAPLFEAETPAQSDVANTESLSGTEQSTSTFEQVTAEQSLADAPQANVSQVAATSQAQEVIANVDDVTKSVLATRNMLRSRKKSLEGSGKKPSDAVKRQEPNDEVTSQEKVTTQENSASNQISTKETNEADEAKAPELPPMPEQAFTPEVINPEVIKKANQVDKWSNMIDSMGLTGRIRQLAIHATISPESTDDVLVLSLDQSTKHLNSDAAHKKLEIKLSEYLARKITVELNVVEKTVDDPFQIQGQINDKRYQYAKDLLHNDDIVVGLKTHFQAELNDDTITAR